MDFGSNQLHLRQVAAQQIVHPQAAHRAFNHAGHGVIHQVGRYAQGFGQQLIDPAQQRAATTQGHATVDDVRYQLRRSLLEHAAAGLDDVLERILQGFNDLTGRQRDRARQASDLILPLHFHTLFHVLRDGRTDPDF